MTLYAQHGWGKGQRIERALDDRLIHGVVLAPHDESPGDMRALIDSLSRRTPKPDLLLDPQLYVSMITNANEGKLPQYPYYRGNFSLRDFATLRNVETVIRDCVDYQRRLALTYITSPTICVESFGDRAAQIALTLSQQTIDYWSRMNDDDRPLLISFLCSELAFMNRDQVSEFLDTISLFEVDGFYLIVDRNTPLYTQDFQFERLAQMLQIIYSLKRSRFKVICGYSDFISLIYSAAGADACATGWSQKLRRFNRARFQPSSGGRRPRDRYSSSKLINSIYLTELDACQEVQKLRAVKSDTRYDQCFDGQSYPSGVSWSSEDNTLHHWASILKLITSLNGSTVRERFNQAAEKISAAQALYNTLAQLGVTFEAPNGNAHLESWTDGISSFWREIGR